MTTMTMSEHAKQWGGLWGHRPGDWATNEEQQAPVYAEALRRLALRDGAHVLDVGCGTGVFLRACADAGARVTGLDASEGLLALAAERVPEADLRLGDLQALPFDDDTFDAVTGFTSFFFAEDIVAALREAGRVAKPGAPILIEVFGRPEHCDIELMKQAILPFRPVANDGGHAQEYWRPGVVEELVPEAGLTVRTAFDLHSEYRYSDAGALCAGMMAAGGAGAVAGPVRQDELRDAIVATLAPCRQHDGSYRLANEWHVVIAQG